MKGFSPGSIMAVEPEAAKTRMTDEIAEDVVSSEFRQMPVPLIKVDAFKERVKRASVQYDFFRRGVAPGANKTAAAQESDGLKPRKSRSGSQLRSDAEESECKHSII